MLDIYTHSLNIYVLSWNIDILIPFFHLFHGQEFCGPLFLSRFWNADAAAVSLSLLMPKLFMKQEGALDQLMCLLHFDIAYIINSVVL